MSESHEEMFTRFLRATGLMPEQSEPTTTGTEYAIKVDSAHVMANLYVGFYFDFDGRFICVDAEVAE